MLVKVISVYQLVQRSVNLQFQGKSEEVVEEVPEIVVESKPATTIPAPPVAPVEAPEPVEASIEYQIKVCRFCNRRFLPNPCIWLIYYFRTSENTQ